MTKMLMFDIGSDYNKFEVLERDNLLSKLNNLLSNSSLSSRSFIHYDFIEEIIMIICESIDKKIFHKSFYTDKCSYNDVTLFYFGIKNKENHTLKDTCKKFNMNQNDLKKYKRVFSRLFYRIAYESKYKNNICIYNKNIIDIFKYEIFLSLDFLEYINIKPQKDMILYRVFEFNNICIKNATIKLHIDTFGISMRTYKYLRCNNIKTFEDLCILKNDNWPKGAGEVTKKEIYSLMKIRDENQQINNLLLSINDDEYTIEFNDDYNIIAESIIDIILNYDKHGKCIMFTEFSYKLNMFLIMQGYLYMGDICRDRSDIMLKLKAVDTELYHEFIYKFYSYQDRYMYVFKDRRLYDSYFPEKYVMSFIYSNNIHSLSQIKYVIKYNYALLRDIIYGDESSIKQKKADQYFTSYQDLYKSLIEIISECKNDRY